MGGYPWSQLPSRGYAWSQVPLGGSVYLEGTSPSPGRYTPLVLTFSGGHWNAFLFINNNMWLLYFPVVHVNHHHGNHELNISMAVNCSNLPSDHGYQSTYDNSASHHLPVLNNATYLTNWWNKFFSNWIWEYFKCKKSTQKSHKLDWDKLGLID